MVDQLSKQFEAQLHVLQQSEEPLRVPVSNEVLLITIPGKVEGQEQQIQVELNDRFRAFQHLADAKHTVLGNLINKWDETQRQLIALAVEILGPDQVITNAQDDQYGRYPKLDELLGKSRVSYETSDAHFEGVVEGFSGFERQVQDLTKETKGTVQRYRQVCIVVLLVKILTTGQEWTAATKQKLDEIAKIAGGMR